MEQKKKNITIELNNTTNESKTVLVFGREHAAPLDPTTVKFAWRKITIGTRGKATFVYPEESSVGAFYIRDDTVVNLGPYPAVPGSSWTIILQTNHDDGTMVKEGKVI